MMTKIATPLNSTQDSSPSSGLTTLALDERLKELRILILKDEEMEKAIEDSLIAVNVSKREALDQLQEQLLAYTPLQIEEIDASIKSRTKSIKSHSTMYKGLVGPQQQRLGHCSNSRIHNFYTKASILSPRGIVDLERVQVDERCSLNLLL
jgi:hypothetical protein